jgi:hypothetical protein
MAAIFRIWLLLQMIMEATAFHSIFGKKPGNVMLGIRASSAVPNMLPPDALILTAPDPVTWELEKKEYLLLVNSLASASFAPYISSFVLKGSHFHSFRSVGTTIEKVDLKRVLKRDSYSSSDNARLILIKDLINGLAYIHLRGLAHVNLDVDSIRIHQYVFTFDNESSSI